MSIITVTGASGFVGLHVCLELAAAGHEVTALSRSSAVPFEHENINWRQVSFEHINDLQDAFDGTECIVHLADNAARLQMDGEQSNLAALVSEAAVAAGVERVIVASSIYARLSEEGLESSYGAGKLKSEETFSAAQTLSPVFLRLPPVYGKNGKGGFAFLTKLIAKKLPLPFGRAVAVRDYISAVNVADLIKNIAEMDGERWSMIKGYKFEPCDMRAISGADLCREIGAVLTVKPKLLPVPKFVMLVVGKLTGKYDAISAAFDELRAKQDPSLETLCGWSPKEAMPESLEFLKET